MNKKHLTAVALSAMLGTCAPLQALAAENTWTVGNPLIAHALGEYEGKIETNSKEAFIQSWENGFQILEADFVYTSDGTLVVRHDFETGGSYYRLEIQPQTNPVMDLQTYQNTPIIYEQTPLTAEDLLKLMVEYTDVCIVTDTKNTDETTVKKQFQDLYDIANNIGHPELLNRIIPQIYHEDMLGWIQSIYNFPQWIYTLYQQANIDYVETAQFCKDNNIGVVTIEKSRITSAVVDTFRQQGILVYAHTINRYIQMQELLAMGVSGIYTDTIKPYELSWVGLENDRKIITQQSKVGDIVYDIDTMEIMGINYVCLRDILEIISELSDCSTAYDMQTNTLSIANTGEFTLLGNELLLNNTGRLVTKKTDVQLVINDTPSTMTGYTIDGELFYPYADLVDALGFTMTQMNGFVSFTKK